MLQVKKTNMYENVCTIMHTISYTTATVAVPYSQRHIVWWNRSSRLQNTLSLSSDRRKSDAATALADVCFTGFLGASFGTKIPWPLETSQANIQRREHTELTNVDAKRRRGFGTHLLSGRPFSMQISSNRTWVGTVAWKSHNSTGNRIS